MYYEPGQLSLYGKSLRAGRSRDRIPVGARYSAPVQTGPQAHPVSCTILYLVYFPGVKLPGRGVNYPPQSSAKFKKKASIYSSTPHWAFMVCLMVKLLCTFCHALRNVLSESSFVRRLCASSHSQICCHCKQTFPFSDSYLFRSNPHYV